MSKNKGGVMNATKRQRTSTRTTRTQPQTAVNEPTPTRRYQPSTQPRTYIQDGMGSTRAILLRPGDIFQFRNERFVTLSAFTPRGIPSTAVTAVNYGQTGIGGELGQEVTTITMHSNTVLPMVGHMPISRRQLNDGQPGHTPVSSQGQLMEMLLDALYSSR